jgi:hypothetical protein
LRLWAPAPGAGPVRRRSRVAFAALRLRSSWPTAVQSVVSGRGTTGLVAAQRALALTGYVVGAAVLARRLDRPDRGPVALLLAVLASASVIALISH